MKLLVCTSNQRRHVAFVRALVGAKHDVVTIVEPKTWRVPQSAVMAKYWSAVRAAECEIFGDDDVLMPTPVITLQPGELSHFSYARRFLNEVRRPIVFSSSYLTGDLALRFVAAGALNLHVGIAPEYRGSAPNFWALYDGHPELVGAQVQRLSTTLDGGEILAEVRPPGDRIVVWPPFMATADPYRRGMLAVQHGITAMVNVLTHPELEWRSVRPNDKALQLRYARHADFTEDVVRDYLERIGR